MIPTDRTAFLQIVIGFAELKGKQLSAAALELYWNSMQHWSIDDFRQAANQLIRSSEFMPTPKDFEDLRKAGRPTAGEAWAQALKFARTAYVRWDSGPPSLFGNTPEPDDPLIARAVAAIGGYQAIAMSPTDKTVFLEKRFCEHFDSIQDAEDVREAVPQIAYSNTTRKLSGPASASDVLGRLGHEMAPRQRS